MGIFKETQLIILLMWRMAQALHLLEILQRPIDWLPASMKQFPSANNGTTGSNKKVVSLNNSKLMQRQLLNCSQGSLSIRWHLSLLYSKTQRHGSPLMQTQGRSHGRVRKQSTRRSCIMDGVGFLGDNGTMEIRRASLLNTLAQGTPLWQVIAQLQGVIVLMLPLTCRRLVEKKISDF